MCFKTSITLIIALLFVLTIPSILTAQSKATTEPEVFGPGIISTAEKELNATFTPDGKRVYFTKSDTQWKRMTILYSDWVDSTWTTPRVASFSGRWPDGDPFISPDGERLFFISRRPVEGSNVRDNWDLWYVERSDDGRWDNPKRISNGKVNTDAHEVYPSVSEEGNIYFLRMKILQEGGLQRTILKVNINRDSFAEPINQNFDSHFYDPIISPDEDFIIIVSREEGPGQGDLFVSFHKDGSWSEPTALPFNTASYHESAPGISTDGETLYFTSDEVPENETKRSKKISYGEVLNELRGVYNGLANIYKVNLEEIINTLER